MKGLDAFYGQGTVLISQNSILKVNDLSFEQIELTKLDDEEFIETILELDNLRSLLLVYSNGVIKFLSEDVESSKVTIKSTGSRFKNLIGGQLHHIANDTIICVRRDKQSELYNISVEE